MFTPNKDIQSWMADVTFVKKEKFRTIRFTNTSDCTREEWETPNYDITTWYHKNYLVTYAIAKDNSHTVAWMEVNGEIHRW